MSFDPTRPYNELPLLPPKVDLESKEVLRKTISAGRALAELKGLGKTIPEQAILINSVILQEAKDSSEIENIITTNDKLFQAFTAKSKKFDPATKEVLRYREALWLGFDELKRRKVLTTNLFVKIVQTIKQNKAGIRDIPGTALQNPAGEIIYTPPEGKALIQKKLRNLEEYIHAEDKVDPLIKMAVAHYQFEAIHPFSDGNGRTGRIINTLFLVLKDLLDPPVLYLSKYIIEHKTEYYRLLRQVTEDYVWEPWILYMLDAVEQTAIFTRQRIIDIRALMLRTMEKAREELPRRVYSKELIELLFRQPYCKISFLVDANIAERKTAAEYLKQLESIGILKSQKVGREVLYLNTELYEVLAR